MTNSNMERTLGGNWKDLFVEREGELSNLISLWEEVQRSSSPRLAIVVGESGVGKTRLVQEFYRHIVRSCDGEIYWPRQLKRSGNNLILNPDVEDCNVHQHMPFLWFSIRCPDQNTRNSSAGGLNAEVETLSFHLYPFAIARMIQDRNRSYALDMAKDIAVEIANAFTFNLAGLTSVVLKHGGRGIEMIRAKSNAPNSAADGRYYSSRNPLRSLSEKTIDDIKVLFSTEANKGKTLPAIFVIDDAHWLSHDKTSAHFIENLLSIASSKSWPILFVATHWEKEWLETDRENAMLTSFQGVQRSSFRTIKINKNIDFDAVILAALAGVTRHQAGLIKQRADGNPRLLQEIIDFLLSKPRYFEGKNLNAALNELGESQVRERFFDLHELIAERLEAAPRYVKTALGLASVQGMRFSTDLIEKTAELFNEGETRKGLEMAFDPHSAISELSSGVSEFSQRVFKEVSKDQLNDILDPEEVRVATLSALRLMDNSEEFKLEEFQTETQLVCWGIGCDSLLNLSCGEKLQEFQLLSAEYILKQNIDRGLLAEACDLAASLFRKDFTVSGQIVLFRPSFFNALSLALINGGEIDTLDQLCLRAREFISDAQEKAEQAAEFTLIIDEYRVWVSRTYNDSAETIVRAKEWEADIRKISRLGLYPEGRWAFLDSIEVNVLLVGALLLQKRYDELQTRLKNAENAVLQRISSIYDDGESQPFLDFLVQVHAEIKRVWAGYSCDVGEIEDARKNLVSAIDILKAHEWGGDHLWWEFEIAATYKSLASLEFTYGADEDAISALLIAEKTVSNLAQRNNSARTASLYSSVLDALSQCYKRNGEDENAKYYSEKALLMGSPASESYLN